MGVIDGQAVDAAVTNPAFINKNQNDTMPNVLGFTRLGSGISIADIQQAVNYLYTASGVTDGGGSTVGTAYNATPGTITNGQAYVSALTALANKFDPATGHYHTGNAGDGPILPVVHTLAVSGAGGPALTGGIALVAGSTMALSVSGQFITFSVAPSINGSASSPQLVSASGGIVLSDISYLNYAWVEGNGAPTSVTATPSITPPTAPGQQLFVVCMSSTNTLTLQDNSVLSGSQLRLDGNATLNQWSILPLISDSNLNWVENVRR